MRKGGLRGSRRWAGRLVLVLLSVAATLLAIEGALRIYRVASFGGTLDEVADLPPPPRDDVVTLGMMIRQSEFPNLVYRLRPDLDAVRNGVAIRTNSDGWREDEIPLEKPPGVRRIVGIGDSVMYGWGVDERERYMDVLESSLGPARDGGGWETVVLAVPGYNAVMAVEALRRFGLSYEPDLVIYGYVRNDDCLPNFLLPPPTLWEPGSALLEALGGLGSNARPLLRRDQVIDLEPNPDDREDFRRAACENEAIPPELRYLGGADAVQRALEDLATLGREGGFPIVLFDYGRAGLPEVVPPGVVEISLLGLFRQILKNEGISNYHESDLAVAPDDPHPSPRFHRIIAEALEWELREGGYLAAEDAPAPPRDGSGS